MAVFSRNVGPVEIVHDGVSLGLTQGGGVLSARQDIFRSVADITGQTARGKYVIGEQVTFKAAITEATHEQLAKMLNVAVEGSTTKAVTMVTKVGLDLLDDVAILILKPIVAGVVSVTEADWITIPAASIQPMFEVPFQIAGQKVWGFEAEGHPVTAAMRATGGHLYNSGSPLYPVGALLRLGKASSV